jgi:hypothetical protein
MNSKQIEETAVHIVGLYFSNAHTISPYISSNDKEPCWDGNLYIYSNEPMKNSTLYGRVPVQIKGKFFKDKVCKNDITYSVSLVDLKNYMRDGGIIYFVVGIWENFYKIYYAKLTPLKLKTYIKHCKRESASIKLAELKEYSFDIDCEIRDFYDNCKVQTGNTDNTVDIKDILSSKKAVNLTFFASALKNNEQCKISEYLAKHPVYLYAETTDGFNNKVLRPVGDEDLSLNFKEFIPAEVKVGDKVYYNEIQRTCKQNGNILIYIGRSLRMEISPDGNVNRNINFKLNETELSSWIKEAEFIFKIAETKCFEIDKVCFKLNGNEENKYIDWCRNRLRFAKKIQSVLSALHVNKELVIKEFSQDEINIINILYKALCEQDEISINESLPPIFTVSLSNLCLALFASKTPTGKYRIYSYKDVTGDISYTDSNTNVPAKTSIYSWFQTDGFKIVSNIDYDDILPSYKKVYIENHNVTQRANNDMLMMILAYDENHDDKLLKSSKDLCEWLISINEKDEVNTYFLNLMQIIKRKRDLTNEERKEIMIKFDLCNSMEKLACCLLLDNNEMANHYFNQLNDSEKEFFTTLPIYHFFNSKSECIRK